MTDCSSIHGSTSSSSDVTSSRGGVISPRIRVIRMIRPNPKKLIISPDNNASFGFAIRGGKEFGTGFFVSRVEKGSEADVKGLRVGDQIIRVNGYHIDDAVHKELTQFISCQDRITLKVRGVGMLPVKEKIIDALTWHIVPHRALSSLTELEEMVCKDVRIVLKVAPRTKLGLGICKGPEWKPGIFVQFTKEFGIAREAGLRLGDQILSCNSIDFSDVLFSEAVAVMKSSQTLEMIVRTGAGLDLFPGESSGYNSSASSVTGDQSPCWGDQASKRLSMVREESNVNSRLWTETNDFELRRNHMPCPEGSTTSNGIDLQKPTVRNENNRTIIQLSEHGTVINNTLISNTNTNVHVQNGTDNVTVKQNNNVSSSSSLPDSGEGSNVKLNFVTPEYTAGRSANENLSSGNSKIADICFVSRQSETKTVIVEVHRSASEENKTASSSSPSTNSPTTTSASQMSYSTAPVPPPKPPTNLSSASVQKPIVQNPLTLNFDATERCPSVASSISSCGATSLSSAISEELKRRHERRNGTIPRSQPLCRGDASSSKDADGKLPPKRLGNPSLGAKGDDKRHSALMDEFKRAHRKMFKNSSTQDNDDQTQRDDERQEELSRATVMRDEVDKAYIKTEMQSQFNGPASTITPIPPPPPQFANGAAHFESKINNVPFRRPLSQISLEPPDMPMPDYDSTPNHTLPKHTNGILGNSGFVNGTPKGTMARVSASEIAKANGDMAELESIQSFQLKNPSSTVPRPPPLYFAPQSSGPPTMKKTKKSVSVTIGEYAGAQGIRKEPSKFDFISKNMPPNYQQQVLPKEENVSDMLRSELEKTLSRSNLKKKNEDVEGLILNGNGQQHNGPMRFASRQDNIGNSKPILQKTQSSNIEKLTNMLQSKQLLLDSIGNNNINNHNGNASSNGNANILRNGTAKSSSKVTISIPNKLELRKTESTPTTPTNGILKNGFTKSTFGDKNITFGN